MSAKKSAPKKPAPKKPAAARVSAADLKLGDLVLTPGSSSTAITKVEALDHTATGRVAVRLYEIKSGRRVTYHLTPATELVRPPSQRTGAASESPDE